METTTSTSTCPGCGYANDNEALSCSMCGALIGAPHGGPDHARAPGRAPHPFLDYEVPLAEPEPVRVLGVPVEWAFVLIGLALAPIFSLAPMLQYMGWFVSSLTHEMGHSSIACFFGSPAFPAIRLDGHAGAIWQPHSVVLAVVVWAALGTALWGLWSMRRARIGLAITVALYPLIAFQAWPRELLHLLGGHIGELAFAALCLWRCVSGGFTHSTAERALYGVLGWHLVGHNVLLCWGLMSDPAARAHYQSNGSFGLTNDYIRVAEDMLGWSLQSVAAMMLLVGIALVPLSLWLGWRSRR